MTTAQCFLCRQLPEVREEVIRRGQERNTYGEIVRWLESQDVHAKYHDVAYFMRINGLQHRFKSISPPADRAERVKVYVTRLLKFKFNTYNIKNIQLTGGGWNGVTTRLRNDGLIESMGGRPRHRWRVLASEEELRSWMQKEVESIL